MIPHLNTHITFFFFNDTATTEIYTLSLHDALPILQRLSSQSGLHRQQPGTPAQSLLLRGRVGSGPRVPREDRKSTRLNSSHLVISYAVFCLKKKKYDTQPFAVYELLCTSS